jgi:hypothetical protein
MKEKLISILKGNLKILEEHLAANEHQWTTEEAKSMSGTELSARLLAKESAEIARDGVKQLLAAVNAYKQCIQVVEAQAEEVAAPKLEEKAPTKSKRKKN